MSNRTFVLIFIFVQIGCFAGGNSADRMSGQEIQKIGQKYTSWLYSSTLDSLKAMILNQDYKFSQLEEFRKKVEIQLGSPKLILNEQFGIEPWQYYYVQYSTFERQGQPVRTLFTFNEKGKILQFSVIVLEKEAHSQYHNYECRTDLSLPFAGEWFVALGGRAINENQHAISSEQRFAYDFNIRKGAKTFSGDGKENSDYYCYEQPVIPIIFLPN